MLDQRLDLGEREPELAPGEDLPYRSRALNDYRR